MRLAGSIGARIRILDKSMSNEAEYFLLHKWVNPCPDPDCGGEACVECFKCGTLSCLPVFGTLPDGSTCGACKSAYDLACMGQGPAMPEIGLIRHLKLYGE